MRFLIAIVFPLALFGQAAPSWDVPYTEVLIAANKKNAADHKEARSNQAVSESTVRGWRKINDEVKKVSSRVDKRLTSAYAVASDVLRIGNIMRSMEEMGAYQKKALRNATAHQQLYILVALREAAILKQAKDCFGFTTLLIFGYSRIAKMKVSDRMELFSRLEDKINSLRWQCYSLYSATMSYKLTHLIEASSPYGSLLNMDIEIIKSILKDYKLK